MATGIYSEELVDIDELSRLDSILAEVDDTELIRFKPILDSNSENTISEENVENFLLCKFNQYSNQENSFSSVNADNGNNMNKAKNLYKITNILNEKKNDTKPTNCSDYIDSPVNKYHKSHIYVDPIFGLRILKPQISSDLLTERMAGKKFITFNELSRQIDLKTSSDWVIAAVILSKEVKYCTKNSSPFTIWKLSDLQGNIRTVTIFLFQNAHKELCKTCPGTCVAILNPSFNKNQSYTQDIASLSIETAKKVLILGTSKDFGLCKAKTKVGKQCTNFINLQHSDFCIFHIKKELKKVTRPFAVEKINLNEHRMNRAEFKEVQPAQFKTKNILEKDKLILDSLSKQNSTISSDNITTNTVKCNESSERRKYGIAPEVEANVNQRKIDLERVKTLYSSLNPSKIFSQDARRMQIKGTETQQIARQKAFEVLKKCPIEKINPNSIRGTIGGKKRALDVLSESIEPKRPRIGENQNVQISGILEAGSNHRDLITVRMQQEEDKYFIKLEKKEAMEEKMLKTFTITCKAVICTNCKYTAFSAADRCKTEKHSLKIIDAVKRFFQCKDCGNRTITLFKLPKFSCSNCKSSRWERSAMIRERKLNDLSSQVSIRGDEEKFLGGTLSKINVNLLVP